MPKILIVHPEGNIKNNPNLFALAKLIVEQGWEVLVYSRKRPEIYQGEIFNGASFVYFPNTLWETYSLERSFASLDIRFVIGIDNYGVYKAQMISRFLNVPYLFLSYEILFDDELARFGNRFDCHYKLMAKKAAKEAVCSVAQDEERMRILSEEYNVPLSSVLQMPVANTGSHLMNTSHYFHQMLHIPEEKKILLYMGWMNEQQEERLIQFAKFMPDDWVLVAHSRYKYIPSSCSPYIGSKLYFSVDKPIENMDDMGVLLSDCQAGFCMYQPRYDNVYEGKNIQYIGLSSGKASTFLQYGVPVVVENMNIWDKIVENYGIGFQLQSPESLQKLDTIATEDAKMKAIKYFNENLDARLYFGALWSIITQKQCLSSMSIAYYYMYVLKDYWYTKKELIRKNLRAMIKNRRISFV